MQKVAILGVGQTKYSSDKFEETLEDMIYEVTRKALDDANMTIQEVGCVVTISNDIWDGRTISCMAIQDACGGYGKNITTVEGDGAFGALYGIMRVISGHFDTVLVVAHSKGSEGNLLLLSNAMFDPVHQRFLGLDAISSSALQARRYMDKHGLTEEQFALVSVKNHGNAFKNPYAHFPMNITVSDVINSKKIADPLKLLDCCPVSDGAAAVIIGNEKSAQRVSNEVAWVKGLGWCSDRFFLGDRDLAESPALSDASQKAYRMAGIRDPKKEIQVVEIYDAFSYMEPLWLEGMGFCEKGAGGALTESGQTQIDGQLPVNPSGGVISSHAVIVAGLARIIEAVLQVRGGAEKHQVHGVSTALAHGINGPCGQSHCVWILGKE